MARASSGVVAGGGALSSWLGLLVVAMMVSGISVLWIGPYCTHKRELVAIDYGFKGQRFEMQDARAKKC